MTKRIVSGIFILTALGALGVILAGALTSGEQLIVRFLTAVIVAALGLYVISDLRLQADDDAMTSRQGPHPRLASVDAPPNSTAAFMATVTKRSEQKNVETGAEMAEAGPVPAESETETEQADQQMVGAGTTTSSTTERTSAVVEDAGSSGLNALEEPEVEPQVRPKAPDTIPASALTPPPTEVGLTELFSASRPAADADVGAEMADSNPAPAESDTETEQDHAATADADSTANDADSTFNDAAAPVELEPVMSSPLDETAVIEALATDYAEYPGPLQQAELAVAAMHGVGGNGSEHNGSRNGHGYRNGSHLNRSPGNGSHPGESHRNGSSHDDALPFDRPNGNSSPMIGRTPEDRSPTPSETEAASRRLLESVEGLDDIAELGRRAEAPDDGDNDQQPQDQPQDEVLAEAGGPGDESTPAFEYSDELQSPDTQWPAPTPKDMDQAAPEPHPFEKASAAYQAEKDRLAAVADSASDLPVVSPKRELEAADYADAPLAPIIDLRHVNSQNPSSVDAAINVGEVEVIATLIEQGMLSTDGPISDRDVRTMVYVAFTSNELRKLLLAGGTPDGPNQGLDLGPVELFDERVHAPAPKTLYSGAPPRRQPQSQIG